MSSKVPEFCQNKSTVAELLGKVAYYPGLTPEERKLISKYPAEALKAFLAKQKAESATTKRFKRDDESDESDAFRHFVWAGLLAKELGPEMAKKFLDAHESNQGIDNAEKAMDLANNRALIEEGWNQKLDTWQLVFLLDEAGKVKEVRIHKNCCD